MLNGVGGSTVEEAKERLSYDELMSWAQLRSMFGSFNTAWRIEYENAKLYGLIWNYLRDSKKSDAKELREFMEHWPEPAEEQEVAPVDPVADTRAIILALGATKRKG